MYKECDGRDCATFVIEHTVCLVGLFSAFSCVSEVKPKQSVKMHKYVSYTKNNDGYLDDYLAKEKSLYRPVHYFHHRLCAVKMMSRAAYICLIEYRNTV